MNLSWFKWRYFLYLALIGFWSVWFINIKVLSASSYIADCNKDISHYPVAIVLGAGVLDSYKASDIYADRLQTATDLYKKGVVDKILVSGDHGRIEYDEVNTGKKYLLDQGVLASDIFLDHAGFDTYSSIYRAKNIFSIREALIVTQDFHLTRALYISKNLGLQALGCSADVETYKDISYLKKREILARVKAWLSVSFGASPKYLGEIFDISGDGQQTWDDLSL